MLNNNVITFDKVIRWIVAIIVLLAIIWLADILKNVLLPFVVACLVSYMLEPLVEFQQRHLKCKHRVIPVFLTLIEILAIVSVVAYFFIPMVINEIGQLDNMVKASGNHSINTSFLPPDVAAYLQKYVSLETLQQYMSGTRLMAVLNKSTTVLSATVDFLLHTLEWLIAIVYVIFIMLDYNHLMRGFRLAVPPRYREKVYPIFDDIKNNMSIYFRSQAVIALCAAIFYCIGFSIVGLPLAIVMGIVVGILYMIPYFQYVTLIPVAILCYIYSLTGAGDFLPMIGKCILVYVISQSICDYILTPKIMGKTLGLNPAIILLSLSVWGTLMGIIGMIIALPMTSLMISYYKRYILRMN
ncbi:MAG: AI-2E family transporter [Muribaculum sp.]|nr:AI-2E family transporter [Muribaculum sp.]